MPLAGSRAGPLHSPPPSKPGEDDRLLADGEGVELAVAAQLAELVHSPRMRLGGAVGEHVGSQLLAAKGSRSGWHRLGGRSFFARHSAGGKRTLLDGKERLAADAVKKINVGSAL